MKKFFWVCWLAGISMGSSFGIALADDNKNAQAKPAEQIPIHKDWFNVKYDDVRENTIIKAKDDFGPGSAARTSDDDNLKLAINATVPGKTFDAKTPITVTVSFARQAGILQQGSKDALFGTQQQDEFKPYHGNQLWLLKDCTDVLLVLPSGQKLHVNPSTVSYKTVQSQGFMGEKYAWETVTVTGGLDLLQSLQNGAKVALCDVTFVFVKDQISQARSLMAVLQDLGSAPAKK